MLLFPLPCARNKKNGNIESRILIGCVPAGSKEKIVVDEAVFWSTVKDELSRITNYFVENIHSFPNLSYPICPF